MGFIFPGPGFETRGIDWDYLTQSPQAAKIILLSCILISPCNHPVPAERLFFGVFLLLIIGLPAGSRHIFPTDIYPNSRYVAGSNSGIESWVLKITPPNPPACAEASCMTRVSRQTAGRPQGGNSLDDRPYLTIPLYLYPSKTLYLISLFPYSHISYTPVSLFPIPPAFSLYPFPFSLISLSHYNLGL